MLAMAATAFEMLQFAKSLPIRRKTVPVAFRRQASRERVERFAIEAAKRIKHVSAG